MITKRFLLIIPILFLSTLVFAQKIANKQFSLIDYNLSISENFVKELSSLESYIDGIKTYNDPGNNKLEAIFVHVIYFTLKEKFEEQLKVEILPINTFLRKIKYDDYGYPETNMRAALKIGYSKYYFKVDAVIESITEDHKKESPETFKDINYPVIIPKLSITVTLFNSDGVVPIDKWISGAVSRYPLPINEYLLKGFDNTQMEVSPLEDNQEDNIYLMLDRTIQGVIQDYYNK